MLHSMTGYASLSGDTDAMTWDWEIRAVNARGLEVRLRLPEGFETLEPVIRKEAGASIKRGNVNVSLKLRRKPGAQSVRIDTDALTAALDRISDISAAAEKTGAGLAPPTATDIMQLPGVLESRDDLEIPTEVASQITDLLREFGEVRRGEGEALGRVLTEQLTSVADLIDKAGTTAEARAARAGEILRDKVSALLETTTEADPDRLAQELALLAVKADVTEEIDRLRAHVAAARDHLKSGGPVGRKLDFLMQEFNREANTLCSKSGSTELTAIGLDLKILIEQMREQVQNLE